MSFLVYLRHRRITDDPAGDFVAVARLDKALPDAETWDELRRYLEELGAAEAIVEAAHRVWRAYLMARLRTTKADKRASERTTASHPEPPCQVAQF